MKVCVTIFELKFLCILTKNWVENILFARFALHLPVISGPIVNEFTIKTLMLYIVNWRCQQTISNSLTINWVYLSFSPLLFTSRLFTAICKASSDSHFAFLHFFLLGMVLIPVSCTMSWTSIHSSSGTLSIRSSPLNLFLTSTV